MSWDGRIKADARHLPIGSEQIQCVVTSPPYWGLRDYGNPPLIWGGDPLCDHLWDSEVLDTEVGRGNWAQGVNGRGELQPGGVEAKREPIRSQHTIGVCEKCDAWLGSLGLEPTPDMYVQHLVTICQEIRRVLRPDGIFWLNLGDCYHSGNRGGYHRDQWRWKCSSPMQSKRGGPAGLGVPLSPNRLPQEGLKDKDLVGMPWRVALALQADGWWLRSDIVWAKPNPMPESVADRPTHSHEYVFMLTKSKRYYYDAEAVKEPATGNAHSRGTGVNPKAQKFPAGWNGEDGRHDTTPVGRYRPRQNASFSAAISGNVMEDRNRRSVWTIPTQPYPLAHYATFPERLPEICIRASTRPGDIVLDPFFGSGTVGRVAEALARRWIGIDLGYQDMQRWQLTGVQRELLMEGDNA